MAPGLPPWPHGVGQLELLFDVNGSEVTTGAWFLDPSGIPADVGTCHHIVNQYVLSVHGSLALLTSRAAELTACSVTISSLDFAHATIQVDPVPGAWTGAQANNVACGLQFHGSVRGKGTTSVMRLPSCPDDFINSNWRLSSIGYANLRDHGADWLNAFNLMTGAGGATLLHGCLHRVRSGAPLTPPLFDITTDVAPSPHILTTRRRLPRGRQVQS